MIYGGDPSRPRSPGRVVELTVAERARVAEAGWRADVPALSPEECRQLGYRISTVLRAVDAAFLRR